MPGHRGIRLFFILLFFVVIAGGIAAALVFYVNRPPAGISAEGTMFRVEEGETVRSIAGRLEDRGLIRSALYLRILSRLKGSQDNFQVGAYKILPGYTTAKVHDLLTSGRQSLVRVTIPEGWTISMIAEQLDERGVTSGEKFFEAAHSAEMVNELFIPGDSVEGYLFPDTYFFPENHPAEAAIRTMVETFFENLREIQPDYELWKRKKLHETVILASIVEREYQVEEEAPLIASVFVNRLKYNIGLESCATLAYIITEIQGLPHPQYITKADTTIDSPYNTYKWHGLPPGPISSPGRIALDAAFHPSQTDFYYFLRKDPQSGEHYFSTDLEEHNQAKRYYLKGEPNL